MNYLRSFDTKDAWSKADKISTPGIYLVEGKCYYNPYPKTSFGDVALYNSKTQSIEFMSSGSYKDNGFHYAHLTPIGVVAVPYNYTPDNTTRIMSLVNMSCTNPATGTTSTHAGNDDVDNNLNLRWGPNVDVPNLKNYGLVNYVDGNTGEIKGATNWVRIPSDTAFNNTGTIDPSGDYYYSNYDSSTGTDEAIRFGPNPILPDGSKNILYYADNMATNDFDGRGNTDKILAAVSGTAWKTASSIENTAATGNYPAAMTCYRFHTTGTNVGDWYLPACGELAFITAKYGAINAGLIAVKSVWGDSIAIEMGRGTAYGYWCWSSAGCSSTPARGVNTSRGSVDSYTKSYTDAGCRVRAFFAL